MICIKNIQKIKIEKEKEKKHEMIFDRLVFWIEEMTEDHHTLELLDKERLFIYRFSYKYDKFHQFDDNSFQQYIINKDKENSEYDLLYLLLTCQENALEKQVSQGYDENGFRIDSIYTKLRKSKREEIKKSIDHMVDKGEFIYVEF